MTNDQSDKNVIIASLCSLVFGSIPILVMSSLGRTNADPNNIAITVCGGLAAFVITLAIEVVLLNHEVSKR